MLQHQTPTLIPDTDSSCYLSSPSSPLPNGLGKLAPSPLVFPLSAQGAEAKLVRHTLLGSPRAAEAEGIPETCWTIPIPMNALHSGTKINLMHAEVRDKAQQEQTHVVPKPGVSAHQFFFASIA